MTRTPIAEKLWQARLAANAARQEAIAVNRPDVEESLVPLLGPLAALSKMEDAAIEEKQ